MKRTAPPTYSEEKMRLTGRIALILIAFSSGPAVAGSLDCSSVLTDTSRSLSARRDLARECLASACRQEARELALAQEATSRFMKMCLADQFDAVSGEYATAGAGAVAVVDTGATAAGAACVVGVDCEDLSVELEATAAGLRAGARADAGHSFVRVPRINEVLER